MSFKEVSHVLFDLDGLLIDSEDIYTESFSSVCAKYGKTFTWEMKKPLLGRTFQECVDKIIKDLDISVTAEEFQDECRKVNEILLPKVQLMDGARELVEHLYNKGVPLALATSSGEDSVNLKMKHHQDILKYFHHLTMGGTDPEVTRGKPDPQIFLVCASRFPDKPKPEKCLVLEDAVNGVKAARAANMQVVAVPDPRIDAAEFRDATLVVRSLRDFKPELFGLPKLPPF